MTPEQSFILQCLGDYCNERQSGPIPDDIDREVLFETAEKQSVSGILYHQLQKHLKQSISEDGFQKAVIQDTYYSCNRAVLLQEIAECFLRENIPFICMKGAALRDLYPTPELRTMGDIDLIIHTDDREKTDRIMTDELGYRKFVDNHDVWTYNLRHFEFEIHDHMFYEHLTSREDYRSYFDQIWDHVRTGEVFGLAYPNMYVPEDDFHFLYLMTHAAKHIINKGAGFRTFLDMVFLSRRISGQNDWIQIEKELEKIQLLAFTKTCFALCERWFSVKMPLDLPNLEEAFFQSVTEKTFEDGTFGLENTQNEGANSAKEMMYENRHYWRTAFKLTVRKLFPPYQDMQLIPWYSFVDGRPWLLPAAWIYRWFYCVVHKSRQGAELLTEPYLKRAEIEKRESYIRKWGL